MLPTKCVKRSIVGLSPSIRYLVITRKLKGSEYYPVFTVEGYCENTGEERRTVATKMVT